MKNAVTKSVRFRFGYSWRKHIESQNNSIYSEFLQVEEELFGGDRNRASSIENTGFLINYIFKTIAVSANFRSNSGN